MASVGEQRLERTVHQAAAVEPIEIIDKSMQPCAAGRGAICRRNVSALIQAVMTEVPRNARLVMADEAR